MMSDLAQNSPPKVKISTLTATPFCTTIVQRKSARLQNASWTTHPETWTTHPEPFFKSETQREYQGTITARITAPTPPQGSSSTRKSDETQRACLWWMLPLRGWLVVQALTPTCDPSTSRSTNGRIIGRRHEQPQERQQERPQRNRWGYKCVLWEHVRRRALRELRLLCRRCGWRLVAVGSCGLKKS